MSQADRSPLVVPSHAQGTSEGTNTTPGRKQVPGGRDSVLDTRILGFVLMG